LSESRIDADLADFADFFLPHAAVHPSCCSIVVIPHLSFRRKLFGRALTRLLLNDSFYLDGGGQAFNKAPALGDTR
jgi:hypothetical protein